MADQKPFRFPQAYLANLINQIRAKASGSPERFLKHPVKMGKKNLVLTIDTESLNKLTPEFVTQLLSTELRGLPQVEQPKLPETNTAATNGRGLVLSELQLKKKKPATDVTGGGILSFLKNLINKRGVKFEKATRSKEAK